MQSDFYTTMSHIRLNGYKRDYERKLRVYY